jgi:acetyl esterase/lipase
MQVRVPEGAGPFPALVLVHGGGWVAGTPSLMSDLARFLTGAGYVTVNTAYTLSNGVAGFPWAVDDVACAVRHAAAHPDSDGTVAIVGFSAGAHIAALTALDDGSYGSSCSLPDPVIPDRLVGMAGPYDVSRLGPLVVAFFGVPPAEDPELWTAGNPLRQAGRNPGLQSLLLHAGNDSLIDLDFATDFAAALSAAGSEALVEVVEGARHGDLQDPDLVGDLIAAWLARDG